MLHSFHERFSNINSAFGRPVLALLFLVVPCGCFASSIVLRQEIMARYGRRYEEIRREGDQIYTAFLFLCLVGTSQLKVPRIVALRLNYGEHFTQRDRRLLSNETTNSILHYSVSYQTCATSAELHYRMSNGMVQSYTC